MDYRKTAQEIYDHIGKKENIISAAHCATRLRLVIGDNSKADKEYVENIEGVKGVFFAQGQMQIILGTGVVWLTKYMMSLFGLQEFLRAVKKI